MRMAIGLAGILVTMGVIIWIMSQITLPATKQALDVKKQVTPKVEQMAGHTSDGTRAVDTVQVKREERNGRLSAIVVTEVVEGAAMDQHFGLKKGDAIIEIGPLAVIGAGSVVLPGSRVGRGASVGALSLVKSSIEPGAVAAGIPARTIGTRDLTELEELERRLRLERGRP